MFFFPYRADLELLTPPLLTIMVCLLCVSVYWQQWQNEREVQVATERFCAEKPSNMYRIIITKALRQAPEQICAPLMFQIRRAADARAFVLEHVIGSARITGASPDAAREYMLRIVMDEYSRFERSTPRLLTARLWFDPAHFDLVRMVTAAFAHGSWQHLAGNLFFFFAFAATVEVILGWWRYLLLLLTLAVGTHAAYALTSLGVAHVLPTVGLSGVVMGMMGMFAWFLPTHGVRCFLWFFIVFTRVSVPAWLLFVWYLGVDVYTLANEDSGGVNLVAHVSGALLGYGLGFALFRRRKAAILAMDA